MDQSRRPDEDSGPFVARILAVLRPDAVDRGVAAAAQGVQVLLGAYTVNMVVMACWSIVVHPAQLPVEVAYYLAAGIPVMFVGYAYLVSKAVGGFVARLVRWNNT